MNFDEVKISGSEKKADFRKDEITHDWDSILKWEFTPAWREVRVSKNEEIYNNLHIILVAFKRAVWQNEKLTRRFCKPSYMPGSHQASSELWSQLCGTNMERQGGVTRADELEVGRHGVTGSIWFSLWVGVVNGSGSQIDQTPGFGVHTSYTLGKWISLCGLVCS